jgi:hypothetical protein
LKCAVEKRWVHAAPSAGGKVGAQACHERGAVHSVSANSKRRQSTKLCLISEPDLVEATICLVNVERLAALGLEPTEVQADKGLAVSRLDRSSAGVALPCVILVASVNGQRAIVAVDLDSQNRRGAPPYNEGPLEDQIFQQVLWVAVV